MRELNLSQIDPSKRCLKFLEKRLESDKYRGNQISQHNRYDIGVVKTMLKVLYDISGMNLMQIRDTDLSKRPYNIAGEQDYADYVDILNRTPEVGRGTQDSVRKNLFVDFNRMGFIDRYSHDKTKTIPGVKSSTKYVALSELGKEFVETNNIFEEHMLYSRGIDNLMSGITDDLLWIIMELEKITEDEYTFFVSFVNMELDGEYYGKDVIIDLVKDYRSLSRFTKEMVKDKIKEYCIPDRSLGNKTVQRDYHNWVNESQQVFMLLNQTVFFEQREKTMFPRVGINAIFDDQEKLVRSLAEKQKYYEYHRVNKKEGFELHHVVPLCWAKSKNEFFILDNHKNLVYIDGYSHARITQNNNKNVILNFNGNDATFTDFNDNTIYCVLDDNILYNPENQQEMKQYNNTLLESIE